MATQTIATLSNAVTSLTTNGRAADFSIPSAYPLLRPSIFSHRRAGESIQSAYHRHRNLTLIPKPIDWSKLRMSTSFSPHQRSPIIKSRKYPNPNSNRFDDTLSGSTRWKFYAAVQPPRPPASLAGLALFAAITSGGGGSVATPLTVVAKGMVKWLELYRDVLQLRCLLSWFPNIPWQIQPFCAIRDLCDPFLGLFREIVPPILGQLDVSPWLAFAVLKVLADILNASI